MTNTEKCVIVKALIQERLNNKPIGLGWSGAEEIRETLLKQGNTELANDYWWFACMPSCSNIFTADIIDMQREMVKREYIVTTKLIDDRFTYGT